MATYYVDSADGNNSSPPSVSWWNGSQPTYQSLAGALAVATSSGDVIIVSHTHAFAPAAAISWDVATAGQWICIKSVNRSTGVLTAGAKETVGANAQTFLIGDTRGGVFDIDGMYLEGNNGSSSSNGVIFSAPSSGGTVFILRNCTLSTPGTGTTAEIRFGTNSAARQLPRIWLINSTVIAHSNTSAIGGVIALQSCELTIHGLTVSYAGANKPPQLFRPATTNSIWVEVNNSDLSGFDSGQLVLVTGFLGGEILFRNCKKHATPSVVSGTWPANNQARVKEINCDSGDTKTKLSDYSRLGTLLSTEGIYRTTAPAATFGSTPIGWQIVVSAASNEAEPYEVPLLTNGWDSRTTALTGTIHLVHDSATNLHNRNVWMDLDYISDASFPKGTLISTRNANPFTGTAVDLAGDADTWTYPGGTFPVTTTGNKQKVVTPSFTPAEGSAIEARLFIALPGTYFMDPQVVVA